MAKRVFNVFLVAVVTIGFIINTWVIQKALAASTKPIIVGCPVPRGSAYGQNGERGLVLAAEEINAEGGVHLKGKQRPLKLEIIDTRDEEPGVPTSEVLLALEKLILQKKVDVIVGGPCMSECGIASMDIYAKYKIVNITSIGCYTPTWDKEKFASNPKKYRYSFRASGSVSWYIKEGSDFLHQIKDTFGFNKMFIMIEDSLMCRKAAEMLEKLSIKDGWEIVGHDKHPIASTDFSVALNKCKKSGAQILFLWAYAPETSILLRQWHDMKIPALPIGFIGAAEDPGFWKAANGKCAYTVVALSEAGNVLSDATPWIKEFWGAYQNRWGVPPRSTGCVSAYESLYILKDAIERANSLDDKELIKALEETNFKGVRGTIRFDNNHQIIYGYNPAQSALGNWIQWQNKVRIGVWPPAAATTKIIIPPWLK